MAALILDASVLIGLLDRADAHHERSVADVERADQEGRSLIVAASAYSEVVAFARAGRIAEARDAIAAMGITVAPLTARAAEQAAALRAQHASLRLPDAMVLACARMLGGDLLTYDESGRPVAELGPIRARRWVDAADLRELWDLPADPALEHDLEGFRADLGDAWGR